jgi:hypothetical protein
VETAKPFLERWMSEQMTALGLVISTCCRAARCRSTSHHDRRGGGAGLHLAGGMWSVAFTDLFQTVVIVIGLTGRLAGRRHGRRPLEG